MKLRLKLTLIVIAMTVAGIAITAVITLTQASSLITEAAYEQTHTLAERESLDMSRIFENYSQVAATMAQVFGEYFTLPVDMRRSLFDDNLDAIVTVNDDIVGMWTAWLPNALDGRDNVINPETGTVYGPYITNIAQTVIGGESSKIPGGYEGWQNLLNMAIADDALIFFPTPVWKVMGGKEHLIMNILYAITDGQTNKQVGVVGITFTLDMQALVDEVSAGLYNGRGAAGIYSNDGLSVAHKDRSRVKTLMRDEPSSQALLGSDMSAVLDAVKNGRAVEYIKHSEA